jgi:hypothetical protein
MFVILLVIGIFQINVYGYQVSETSDGVEIKWDTGNVTFHINTSEGPTQSLFAIQLAMQTWTDVNTSYFTFVYGGTTTSTAYGANDDGINIVVFGPMGATGVLAENTFWYYADSGYIIDSDIKFNTDYTWGTDGSAGIYDVQNVGTHELGHSLSLDDIYDAADSEKTMYGYVSAGETKKRTLHQDDIDGISYLYPASVSFWNLGDMNKDGIIDISDVILVLRIAVQLDPSQPCSDLNNDGSVDISDVILTLRMAVGLDALKQCS